MVRIHIHGFDSLECFEDEYVKRAKKLAFTVPKLNPP
jgi:hypothetical protein